MDKRYEVIDEKKTTTNELAHRIFQLNLETGKQYHYESIGYGLGRIVEDP